MVRFSLLLPLGPRGPEDPDVDWGAWASLDACRRLLPLWELLSQIRWVGGMRGSGLPPRAQSSSSSEAQGVGSLGVPGTQCVLRNFKSRR